MKDYLIVLDINNTLIAKIKKSDRPNSKDLFSCKHHYLSKRNHTDAFVNFLHSHNLDYIIWSTAKSHNIQSMLVYLREIGYTNYLGFLSQEHCEEGKITDKIKSIKSIKNLEIASKEFKKDLGMCILVDDSPEKSVKGQNYLKIDEIADGDTELIRVAFELDKFVGCHEECEIKKLHRELNILKF
ncbi:hypothetical protein NGRA_0882 [Nosema granulosis]|uniref:Mitochondrial import inner membrane translocase subunit TIM50 n=1 Tax=Nosema granulosis TaxID=83296 RepID=A0A9P6KZR2_9MICR|nr:hypothetical protein NGRA_0882 [Nosema granulosis]